MIFTSGGGQLVNPGRGINRAHHPGVTVLGEDLDGPDRFVQVGTRASSDLLSKLLVLWLPVSGRFFENDRDFAVGEG
ncbi:MAG: hypothetical protein UW94_C0001G0072 [Parcubacteria group bacterium GW2011_GWA2_45_14]|nr:MAG: hypothetical protein UW94_C0001G0072 [Parcubacteria group bacterium GW2011_GWA2_45_14]